MSEHSDPDGLDRQDLDRHDLDRHDLDRHRIDLDDPLAQAFHRALDTGPDDPTRLPVGTLARIQHRATQRHRRRLAAKTAVTATMVAAAIAVAPGVHRGTSAQDLAAANHSAGGPTVINPRVDPHRSPTPDPPLGPVTTASLLRPEQITGLGSVTLTSSEMLPADDAAVGGACVEDVLPVQTPSSGARADWLNKQSAGATSGLVETVWRWGGPEHPAKALDAIASQVAGCSGPGLEGHGSVTTHDATALTPTGGRALVLTSSNGPTTDVQILMIEGTTLVRLQATTGGSGGAGGSAVAAQAAAAAALTDTARAAASQAFGAAPATS